MPAALFMAFVRSTLRASLTVEPDPSHAFSHANVLTCADAPDGMFVTIFYLGLKPGSGELTYVNAGHNPPLLCRASRPNPAGPELLGRTGVALGLDAGMPYSQKALEMVSGDLMVLYTDGVTDALNPQGEEYGMERLMATLAEVRQKSAEEIAATIENELQTFMDGRDPYDDVTLLIVRRV